MEPCIFKSRILGNKKCVYGHEQKSNTIYIEKEKFFQQKCQIDAF